MAGMDFFRAKVEHRVAAALRRFRDEGGDENEAARDLLSSLKLEHDHGAVEAVSRGLAAGDVPENTSVYKAHLVLGALDRYLAGEAEET